MSNKFVIYRRLSKEKLTGQQYGFEAQKYDIDNFLAKEGDVEIVGDFSEFYTGKTIWTQRKELVKAVELCKQTGATLLVSKVDRLGRQVESVSHLLNNINVRIATMPSATNMVIQIMAVMAEEEARAIAARTKAALAVKKAEGVKLGAAAHKEAEKPKHLKRQPAAAIQFANKFAPELKIMRDVGLTYEQIAGKFNTKGYVTREGSSFNKIQVQRMCKRLEIK